MAKSIMIQGTMSGVGKSLLVAGLCRILKEDGIKVAPFKSQNMALNSYITHEGLEMGRAQVVQAEAAGILPTVNMNPILLKPTTDVGSQVIVNGEVVGNMSAKEYFALKKSLLPRVKAAYDSLAKEFDVIVIEGAGSPAEINLKSEDIVNMGMAKLVDAPVLLVGDIDRGGVFAQLLGTMELLEEEEQKRVKGLFVNKFRGDKEILLPGITMLEEKIKRSVLGIVPYLYVDIEEEDSLSDRFQGDNQKAMLDIAVIKFPRMSNYTDIAPLEAIEGIGVRYITNAKELKVPDLLILPGSKSTMEDLKWLRECGLEGKILQMAKQGMLIIGICGGYQMLGESLLDLVGVEGSGSMRGLGLLPIETKFLKEKKRTQVEGKTKEITGVFARLSNLPFTGYEIHMGISSFIKDGEIFQENGRILGVCNGTVLGTYVHGIFEQKEIVDQLLEILLERKGIPKGSLSSLDFKEYKEQQYSKLAEGMRKSLDMEQIYQIIEQGEAYNGCI